MAADSLGMRAKLPTRLPTLADTIRDLGTTPATVATELDVATSTVYRWLEAEKAPRSAMLALFWLTSWGQSHLDADLWNLANISQGLARALRDENANLRARITYLERVGDFGSANDALGLDGAATRGAVAQLVRANIVQA